MVWPAEEILQLGYVCRTLHEGIRYFAESQGVGPFYTFDVPAGLAQYRFRGAETRPTRNRVAFGYRGPLQYELFETDNPLFEHVRGDRAIAHHHCMQMSQDFERDRAQYVQNGFATVGTAKMRGALIHYIDTREMLGHYTELFDYQVAINETAGEMFKLFALMRQANRGWSGDRPVRDIADLVEAPP